MCDQTEIGYLDGDVVWVKMGNCWWPGEVCGESRLPDGLLSSMKKPPIAVVRFFQEKTFEYVKNLNNIYKYNCIKKNEFIKKGLDMHRGKKLHMEKFPADVQLAEKLTGGNPDIIYSEEFAPEVRKKWTDLFEDTSAKKAKNKGRTPTKPKVTPIVGTPRPITHPRFIRKAIDGTTDHEVRILTQPSSSYSTPTGSGGYRNSYSSGSAFTPPNPQQYKCHLCNFSSGRLNVVILHSKNHSNDPPPQQKGKRAPSSTTPKPKATPKTSQLTPAAAKKPSPAPKVAAEKVTPKTKTPVDKTTPVVPKKSPAKKPVASTSKQRASKRNASSKIVEKTDDDDDDDDDDMVANDSKYIIKKSEAKPEKVIKPEEELKTTLLADWSEDESEVLGFEADVEANVRIINKFSSKSPSTSTCKRTIDLSDIPNVNIKEPVRVQKELVNMIQNAIAKKVESMNNVEIVESSTAITTTVSSEQVVTTTSPVMKYRNIPKKQRYLFNEDTDPSLAVPPANVKSDTDSQEVQASTAETPMEETVVEEDSVDVVSTEASTDLVKEDPSEVTHKPISTKERILSRASRRRTASSKQIISTPEEALVVSTPVIVEEEIVAKQQIEHIESEKVEEEQEEENLISQPDTKTVLPIEDTPEDAPEGAPEDAAEVAPENIPEDVPGDAPDKYEESVDNVQDPQTDKSIVDEQKSPKKETSCFDFEDDEEMPLKSPPTRRRSRKSGPSTDLSTAPLKIDEIESPSVNTPSVDEVTDDVTEQAESTEKDDEALKSEIASLLKETEVPKIPLEVYANNDVTSTSIDIKERKLPPKERGKRIFKSRNKSEASTTINSDQTVTDNKSIDEQSLSISITSPTSAKLDDTETSPSSVAVSKTLSPAAEPQFESNQSFIDDSATLSICKISTTPTEADLQVAEALIALPDATIQAAIKRDNHVENTEQRRTSSRRENKKQLAQMAAENQSRRDIEAKVEAAEFLVGLSMSTGTSPITELPPVSQTQVTVDTVESYDPASTPLSTKRSSRKRHLKNVEDLKSPESNRTRTKKNKLDPTTVEEHISMMEESTPIVSSPEINTENGDKKRISEEKQQHPKKGRKSNDPVHPQTVAEEIKEYTMDLTGSSSSKRSKRRHYDSQEIFWKDTKKEKKEGIRSPNNFTPVFAKDVTAVKEDSITVDKQLELSVTAPCEMVDLEEEIPIPSFVIDKTLISKTEAPSTSPTVITPKGSSKRKSKREQIKIKELSPLSIVEKKPSTPVPVETKDESIFDITNMPIVISDEPLALAVNLDPIIIDESVAVSKNSRMLIVSPKKSSDAHNDLIRNSISPTNSKPSTSSTNLKKVKLVASDTQKIKELQQKSIQHSPPIVAPKANLVKSQIILTAGCTSSGSPGSPAAMIARTSMSSPSASEDENHLHLSSKRFSSVKRGLSQDETKLSPGTPTVLPKNQLIITSKGTLITTQSSPATSMATFSSSDSTAVTTSISSPFASTSVSSTTISSSSAKLSKNRKSPKIQLDQPEPINYPSSKTGVAANASKMLQQSPKHLEPAPEQLIAQTTVRTHATGMSTKEKNTGGKREIIRMSPGKLAEMTRLGFIEDKPHGKVLTPSGVRKMQEQKLLSTKSAVSTIIPPTPSLPLPTTSLIVLDQKKCLSPLTITTTAIVEPEVINSPIEEPPPVAPTTKEKKSSMDKTNTSNLQSPMLATSDVEEEKTTCDMEDDAATTSKLDVTTNIMPDTQIAAIPAENFGGPPNAFYLCSVSEDGNLKPMKDKIYILDGVTSRLIAVDSDVEEEIITVPNDQVESVQDNDVIEIPEEEEEVVGELTDDNEEPSLASGDTENPNILINIGDQQIVLDQQTLLTLAAGGDISGEMPQLMNTDGQPLLLQGYAQEILAALAISQSEHAVISDDGAEQQILISEDLTGVVVANQPDDLATALASSSRVGFESDQLLVAVGGGGVVVQNQSPNLIDIIDSTINFQSSLNPPPVQAHVSETNAVLTQPPIMSTVEVPTSTKINSNGIGCLTTKSSATGPLKMCSSLDESLAAVIGVTNPTSLELVLPITVTNPAIAPKVTNPMHLSTIYPTSMLPVAGLPLVTSTTIAPTYGNILIDERIIAETISEDFDELVEEEEEDGENNNLDDEIIPVTPEHNTAEESMSIDESSTNSSEIPIQPNLVLREEHLILNDLNDSGSADEFSSNNDNTINESNQNNFNMNINNHSNNRSNNSNLIGHSR